MKLLALLVAAAGLAATAGSLPAPVLVAPAAALAFVAVGAAVAVVVGARRARVTRTLIRQELVEDEALAVRFAARGLARLPVRLEAEVDAGRWAPLGPRGGEVQLRLARGEHRLGPTRLRLRDVLGICSHRMAAGSAETILVLPAPDLGGSALPAGGRTADDDDPDGLVPYAPGTPVARVHWPALARGAGLMAWRVAAQPGGRPLVVVEVAGARTVDAVDRVARAAAGQILRLSQTYGCQVLLPGDRASTTVADAAAWEAIHRRLARMEPSGADTAVPPPRTAAHRRWRWRRR